MNTGDSDHSDNHHGLPQRGSQSRSTSDGPEQTSANLHEHFHVLHAETAEKAKALATEEEQPAIGGSRTRKPNLLISANQLKQSIEEMKERILSLEKQVKSASLSGEFGAIGNISAADPTHGVNVMFEDSGKDSLHEQQILPQLRERSWSDFMNKQMAEKNEYAIEVLVEEPNYFHSKKETERVDRRLGNNRLLYLDAQLRIDSVSSECGDEAVSTPERIRINSHWILNKLASLDRNIDATGPMVMLRPFKFLVYYENQIKISVREMEDQLDGSETTTSTHQVMETVSTEPSATGHEESTGMSGEHESRQTTVEHMRCLIDFIDRYIKPTVVRLGNNSDGKIRFADLWYLFRPGEDIYMPLQFSRGPVLFDMKTPHPEIFQPRYQMMWRVTGTGGGRQDLSITQARDASVEYNPFKVNCYYLDFDGRYFCPTTHTFSIQPYEGDRDILSLDFYPARLAEDAQQVIKEHLDKGKNFFDNIVNSSAHYYYAGPTLTSQPCSCPIQNGVLHQEHVESEVIVDFKMTLIKNPSWRPNPSLWKNPPTQRRELQEKHPVRYWSDTRKTKLRTTEHDHIYDDYDIDEKSSLMFKSRELIFTPIPSPTLSNANMVPERDFYLLPSRVFAFVLRTRSFAPLSLWLLEPIKPQVESLHNLQLRDDSFKNTIQALVRTHFIQKHAQKTSDFQYDVVRGKGKGLVILLHGAPGVGKTFTAESVAAANGKPLFQITCGDLGLTPGEVETALKEIFRFAQQWSCVLLLDECDIFLAQRSKNDIKRNSLVSVFLRVLEFYTGVLFLTTNRVGVLDDAIKSRITWIAYYPPLDEQQTKKIWKVNIKLLEERYKRLRIDKKGILKFAKEHFISSAANNSTWNGRQIQNAFKVATALAEWDAYSNDVQHNIDTKVADKDMPDQPTLLASHFHTIAAGTQAFSSYLQEATGYTEAERAFNAMERADDHTFENNAYSGGSLALQQDNDRNQFPQFSPSSPFSRKRRSSSITVAPPQPFGRGSPALPPVQTKNRRPSNQAQHRPSLLSPTQNRSSSRKSSGQHGGSMDAQLQASHSNRSSYSSSHGVAPSSPLVGSALLSAMTSQRHRSVSNPMLGRLDDPEDNGGAGNWSGSSENEQGDGDKGSERGSEVEDEEGNCSLG